MKNIKTLPLLAITAITILSAGYYLVSVNIVDQLYSKKRIKLLKQIDPALILKFFYETTIYNQLIKPNYTRAEYLYVLYQMTKDVTEVLDSLKIDYRIIGGTLLGSVRHEGIIPWTDSISIAIDKKDHDRFEMCAVYILENLNYLSFKDSKYFRIIAGNYHIDLNEDELYPACDIFTATTKNNKKVIDYNRTHMIDIDQWDNKKQYMLGVLLLWGVSRPYVYLNNLYGRNWSKFAIRGKDNKTISGHEASRVPFTLSDKDYKTVIPSKPLVDNSEKIANILSNSLCK